MDFSNELQKLILDKLKKSVKIPKTNSNLNNFVDSSNKTLGFSRITKKGYTP